MLFLSLSCAAFRPYGQTPSVERSPFALAGVCFQLVAADQNQLGQLVTVSPQVLIVWE